MRHRKKTRWVFFCLCEVCMKCSYVMRSMECGGSEQNDITLWLHKKKMLLLNQWIWLHNVFCWHLEWVWACQQRKHLSGHWWCGEGSCCRLNFEELLSPLPHTTRKHENGVQVEKSWSSPFSMWESEWVNVFVSWKDVFCFLTIAEKCNVCMYEAPLCWRAVFQIECKLLSSNIVWLLTTTRGAIH